jgi:hypothetical protein
LVHVNIVSIPPFAGSSIADASGLKFIFRKKNLGLMHLNV